MGRITIDDNHAKIQIENISKRILPDLTGLGPRDALYLLEKEHLKVRLQGTGKVIAQSLPQGHIIKPNEVITLYLGCVNKRNPVNVPQSLQNDSVKKQHKDSVKADSAKKKNRTP